MNRPPASRWWWPRCLTCRVCPSRSTVINSAGTGHRPEGQGQRRPADRRTAAAQGADRGGLRPGRAAHRCAELGDHQPHHPPGVQAWRNEPGHRPGQCGDPPGARRQSAGAAVAGQFRGRRGRAAVIVGDRFVHRAGGGCALSPGPWRRRPARWAWRWIRWRVWRVGGGRGGGGGFGGGGGSFGGGGSSGSW
ncbi:hypothetical protein CSV86_001195 [Pseudomonas putida CSV86]|uniref:Uncharacterized protein n=1 Tax=Pseudomonas bharatica CSV86 TaxID=1005395 RepID=A0A7K4E8H6_9PSED|nr:hypothetical protein [Pseudomonas bharatica CSV86]